jgi:hypothetical protein
MAHRILVTIADDGSVGTEINPPAAEPVLIVKADDSVRHDTPMEIVISAIAHEANRQYCRSIGDDSEVIWADAAPLDRVSVIDGVREIQLGAVTSPEQAHEAWMSRALASGWVYGPQKDVAAKVHPSLVPFAQLPADQQVKNHLFFAIVTTLLAGR